MSAKENSEKIEKGGYNPPPKDLKRPEKPTPPPPPTPKKK